jgi:outer membrane protein OmpA-like peptidoglycan-associated protein
MKTLVKGLILAILVAAPAWAEEAETIGQIRTLDGSASILRGNATIPAAVGTAIRRGDVIRTGKPGAAGLVLLDDTAVSLGSLSELAVPDYAFDPKEHRFSLVLRMVRGTFSYFGGLIGKLAPETIQLRIPNATISVRGTKLLVEAEEPASAVGAQTGKALGERRFCLRGDHGVGAGDDGIWLLCNGAAGAARQTIILMPDPDGTVGKAEVTTAGGTQSLTKAGDMTRVTRAAEAPSAVVTADPAYISSTFKETLKVEPPRSERFILYFEPGTTTLTRESEQAIPAIVSAIRRRAAVAVDISGHTDATGSDDVNNKLSLDRAERVRELLLQQEATSGRMSVSSHGQGNPAVARPRGVAEPRNRRVEVLVK